LSLIIGLEYPLSWPFTATGVLGNCSMRRFKRLLLVHYLLHPCSRKGLPSVALLSITHGEGKLKENTQTKTYHYQVLKWVLTLASLCTV
jgi:hypothetical protein